MLNFKCSIGVAARGGRWPLGAAKAEAHDGSRPRGRRSQATPERIKACCKHSLQPRKRVRFGNIYGFYDVTGNYELDFQAIGWLYLGAAFDFSSCFFEFFLMAISMKIGQVPHSQHRYCLFRFC